MYGFNYSFNNDQPPPPKKNKQKQKMIKGAELASV